MAHGGEGLGVVGGDLAQGFHDLGVYVYAAVYAGVGSCTVGEVGAVGVWGALFEGLKAFLAGLSAEGVLYDESNG